jgi:hypothetical protein
MGGFILAALVEIYRKCRPQSQASPLEPPGGMRIVLTMAFVVMSAQMITILVGELFHRSLETGGHRIDRLTDPTKPDFWLATVSPLLSWVVLAFLLSRRLATTFRHGLCIATVYFAAWLLILLCVGGVWARDRRRLSLHLRQGGARRGIRSGSRPESELRLLSSESEICCEIHNGFPSADAEFLVLEESTWLLRLRKSCFTSTAFLVRGAWRLSERKRPKSG